MFFCQRSSELEPGTATVNVNVTGIPLDVQAVTQHCTRQSKDTEDPGRGGILSELSISS